SRGCNVARRREQCAIAAEHHNKVRVLLDRNFPLRQFVVWTKFLGDRVNGYSIAVIAQPARDLTRNMAQFGLALLANNGTPFHLNSACRRNSRLPSMPRIGDSITSRSCAPSRVTSWWTFATASCCAC